MKLVKVGNLWYMNFQNTLGARAAPIEDVEQWSKVGAVSGSEYETLSSEFPDTMQAFSLEPTGEYKLTTSESGNSLASHVIELKSDSMVPEDKYVTYHAVVAAKQ